MRCKAEGRRGRLRLASPLLIVSLVSTLTATPVGASSTDPQPVLDSAPRQVGFGSKAVIKGHLKGGVGVGERITLQHKRVGSEWREASVKRLDRDGRVTFKRQDLKKTTVYRLSYRDPETGQRSKSERAKVRVTPKLTLNVNPADIFVGRSVRLSGHLFPAAPDRAVVLQQKVQGEWRFLGRAPVDQGYFSGRFTARFKGHRRVRATFRGDSLSSGARTKKDMTIYERDPATWYGPGLYGNRTACGQTLTTETLGVAHRTLPCGTTVSLLYRGRTITVPVIDRGPYSHADWDLTSRTAQRLGFSGSEDIGTTR